MHYVVMEMRTFSRCTPATHIQPNVARNRNKAKEETLQPSELSGGRSTRLEKCGVLCKYTENILYDRFSCM